MRKRFKRQRVVFTEEQKSISRALLSGPKTVEELKAETGLPYDRLSGELKTLSKLSLVERSGYPTKYAIKKELGEKLRERKEIGEKDPFEVKLRAVIEVQTVEEGLLKKQLDKIEKLLMEDEDFTVYDVEKAGIEFDGSAYSSYVEAVITVKDFRGLMRLMFLYGPTVVEVLKPDVIEVPVREMQDALMFIAEIVQGYTEYISKKLNVSELESFARRIFE